MGNKKLFLAAMFLLLASAIVLSLPVSSYAAEDDEPLVEDIDVEIKTEEPKLPTPAKMQPPRAYPDDEIKEPPKRKPEPPKKRPKPPIKPPVEPPVPPKPEEGESVTPPVKRGPVEVTPGEPVKRGPVEVVPPKHEPPRAYPDDEIKEPPKKKPEPPKKRPKPPIKPPVEPPVPPIIEPPVPPKPEPPIIEPPEPPKPEPPIEPPKPEPPIEPPAPPKPDTTHNTKCLENRCQ